MLHAQTPQPLIWLARRLMSSSILAGTRPRVTDLCSACSESNAPWNTKAGCCILASIVVVADMSIVLSHLGDFVGHWYDTPRRRNVTDG